MSPELVDLILSGEKIKTYRFGHKYDHLKVGDRVKITNSQSNELITNAIIIDKFYQDFKDLPIDIPGHEPYQNKEHQRQIFNGYYKYLDRPIRDDDKFIVFEFKLLN